MYPSIKNLYELFFVSYLISHPRTFRTAVNTNGEDGQSCFVHDHWEKALSVSPLPMLLVESVIEDYFNQTEEIPFCFSELTVFILNEY